MLYSSNYSAKVTVTGVIMSEGDLNAKHIARAANVTPIPSSTEQ